MFDGADGSHGLDLVNRGAARTHCVGDGVRAPLIRLPVPIRWTGALSTAFSVAQLLTFTIFLTYPTATSLPAQRPVAPSPSPAGRGRTAGHTRRSHRSPSEPPSRRPGSVAQAANRTLIGQDRPFCEPLSRDQVTDCGSRAHR